MAYNEDSSASGNDEPWIQWFCGLKGHEMFCEVERSYIIDGFNLYGLRSFVSNFSDCLDLILDRIGADDSDDSHLTQSACTLYGLIHARYIITAHGLDAMYNKYASKEFGTCPLVQCYGQPVLPVGLRDEMGADTVKVFCPKCQCVYYPPPVRSRSSCHVGSTNHSGSGGNGVVDGAAFGTTFPHLFLMTFNNLVPDALSPDAAYVPRVFGFRVHPIARQRKGGASCSGGGGGVADISLRPSQSGSTAGLRRGYTAASTTTVLAEAGVNGTTGGDQQETLVEADVINTAATVKGDSSAHLVHDEKVEGKTDKTVSTPAAVSLQLATDTKTVHVVNNKLCSIQNTKKGVYEAGGPMKRKSKGFVGDGHKNSSTTVDDLSGTGGKSKRHRKPNGT